MHGWHLHRQNAARCQAFQQARKQHLMPIQPLQRGIAENHIHRRFRCPSTDLRLRRLKPRRRSLGEHRGTAIHAHHARSRKTRRQYRQRIARAAAQIHHTLRRFMRNARDQIQRRAQPFILKLQIGLGVPNILRRHRKRSRISTLLSRPSLSKCSVSHFSAASRPNWRSMHRNSQSPLNLVESLKERSLSSSSIK